MGSILVILSAFGFSTLGIFGKLAFNAGFSRNESLFWRFLIALPVFVAILGYTRSFPKSPRSFFKAILLGFVGIGIEASLYFITLEHVGAALTGVLLYLYPAFVALLSFFVFKQKISPMQWFCIGLSFLGCILTVDLTNSELNVTGIFYGIAMAAWYAIYLMSGDLISKNENPLAVSGGVNLGSLLAFTIALSVDVFLQGHAFKVPALSSDWKPLVGLALLATVLPFTTLYAGMKRIGVTKTAILSTLEMVFTLVLAVFCLDEKLTPIQLAGAFLILLSVLLIKPLR